MILIVDDDPKYCDLLRRMLLADTPSLRIGVAHDGRRALDGIAEEIPAVVVLDLMIPFDSDTINDAVGLDLEHLPGVEILDGLLAQGVPTDAIVVVTAVINPAFWTPLIERGIRESSILVKPVRAEDLSLVIRRRHTEQSRKK